MQYNDTYGIGELETLVPENEEKLSVCKTEIKERGGYWDEELETMPRNELDRLQERLLSEQLKLAEEN